MLTTRKELSEMNDDVLNDRLKNADPSRNSGVQVEVMMQEQQWVTSLIVRSSGSYFGRFWQSASRVRKSLIAFCLVAFLAFFGTGSTIVAHNLLDDFWVRSINDQDCGVSGDNARLVQSGVDSVGTSIEYWVVNSGSSVVDAIIQDSQIDGASGGSMSCDHHARKANQPFLQYSAYGTSDGVAHVTYFGWIPPATKAIAELENGRRVSVESNINGSVLAFSDQKNMIGLMPKRLVLFDENQEESLVIDLHKEEK
jgi:hypothetical protein